MIDDALKLMIEKHNTKNQNDRENAIKEVLQEIILCGLSRSDFFNHTAFYGGTCLRIFYNLNRFSEDLDFALVDSNYAFDIKKYFPFIKKELNSYGINAELICKEKNNESDIQTSLINTNAIEMFILFYAKNNDYQKIVFNKKIKIKFEIDITNVEGAKLETKFKLLPSPYHAKIFDLPSLFAGKIHAILCRNYNDRIKGRDYYDYLFYCKNNVPVNIKYLENKLKKRKLIDENCTLSLDIIKRLLTEKFNCVNFKEAKKDVESFVENANDLSQWSKELFISTLIELK